MLVAADVLLPKVGEVAMIDPQITQGTAVSMIGHSDTLAGRQPCGKSGRRTIRALHLGNIALFKANLVHQQQRQRSQTRRHLRRAFDHDDADQADRTSSKACLHCCCCGCCCCPRSILHERQRRGHSFVVGCRAYGGRTERVWLTFCYGRIFIHWTGGDPIGLVYNG